MERIAILDIQCFIGNSNEFIVKELAILPLSDNPFLINDLPVFSDENNDTNGTNHLTSYLFHPPCNFYTLHETVQRTNNFLTKFHHRLRWADGSIPYSTLPEVLKRAISTFGLIFVKGSQKCAFLENVFRTNNITGTVIINMEAIIDKSLGMMVEPAYPCFHAGSCAIRNCIKLSREFFSKEHL